MGSDNRRNITVTNAKCKVMLSAAANASELIEESLLYLDYQIQSNNITERELRRLIDKGLIQERLYIKR